MTSVADLKYLTASSNILMDLNVIQSRKYVLTNALKEQ
jgi:hypothetical protein